MKTNTTKKAQKGSFSLRLEDSAREKLDAMRGRHVSLGAYIHQIIDQYLEISEAAQAGARALAEKAKK